MTTSPQPTSWELQLHRNFADGRFAARFGAQVKTVGGRYTHCRGHEDRRFVHVPNTTEGRAVLDRILALVNGDMYCAIARGLWTGLPAWVIVIDHATSVEDLDYSLQCNFKQAISRGIKVVA